MEYILALLTAVLAGLILDRQLPVRYKAWSNYCWGILGLGIMQALVFAPYRVFRVLQDLGHLLG
ncbi:MAG: hypothetical protein IJ876_05280 [Elusimicrobiaceae bacterium]|nr:hypothetical protein [Elusimicrobiaceae bacterium]